MSNVQLLPPKMAAQWAEKALAGKADVWLKPSTYIFYQGRNNIVLVSLSPPSGHLERCTQAEVAIRSPSEAAK